MRTAAGLPATDQQMGIPRTPSSVISTIIDLHPNRSKPLYTRIFLSCASVYFPPFSPIYLTYRVLTSTNNILNALDHY